MEFVCAYCNCTAHKLTGEINRAKKHGLNIYCGRKCSGLGRRREISEQQKKEEKRIYDMAYRQKNVEMLREKKAVRYKASITPEKRQREREYRTKVMPRHVEYCRNPEYRVKKKGYDREHRAKKYHGEFWEALLVLQDIEKEVATRMPKQEIRALNGTLNKWKQRRRDYDRLISQFA